MAKPFFVAIAEIFSNIALIVTAVLIATWIQPVFSKINSFGENGFQTGILIFLALAFLFKLLAEQLKKD